MNSRGTIDRIRIATPCPVSWEKMRGDSRVRHCDHCQLNVYNISSLSRSEAEALVMSKEGRFCARLYRRSDGTVLTRDCPVGLRAMRRRISKIAAAICAIVGSLTSPALGQNQKGLNEKSTSQTRRRLEDASNFQETIFSGTVLDPVGAVIPSAIVLLQNQITKDIQQTTANENGLFQFTGMAPGKYLSK